MEVKGSTLDLDTLFVPFYRLTIIFYRLVAYACCIFFHYMQKYLIDNYLLKVITKKIAANSVLVSNIKTVKLAIIKQS